MTESNPKIEEKVYRDAMEILVDRIVKAYSSMALPQRFTLLAATLKALGEHELSKKVIQAIPEAVKLEIHIDVLRKLYRNGELDDIKLPREFDSLKELEVEALSLIISKILRGESLFKGIIP